MFPWASCLTTPPVRPNCVINSFSLATTSTLSVSKYSNYTNKCIIQYDTTVVSTQDPREARVHRLTRQAGLDAHSKKSILCACDTLPDLIRITIHDLEFCILRKKTRHARWYTSVVYTSISRLSLYCMIQQTTAAVSYYGVLVYPLSYKQVLVLLVAARPKLWKKTLYYSISTHAYLLLYSLFPRVRSTQGKRYHTAVKLWCTYHTCLVFFQRSEVHKAEDIIQLHVYRRHRVGKKKRIISSDIKSCEERGPKPILFRLFFFFQDAERSAGSVNKKQGRSHCSRVVEYHSSLGFARMVPSMISTPSALC